MSQSDVLEQKIVYVVAVLSCAHLSTCVNNYEENRKESYDCGSHLTLVMTLPARSSQFSLLYPGT